jgi:poly(A) polymerase|tara:strand:- start:1575 stop:2813 length:1239 start_codon:yes stop_codon:yes gene_type:complete
VTEIIDYLRNLISPVTERFVNEQHTLFLVGGVVRDSFINQKIKSPDLDLTTNATPDQIRALVEPVADAVWLQGERFGTIGLRIGEIRMEITTHRSESYITSSRKPSVTFSLNLEDDLSRRDFTVNAMAFELDTGNFFDPFNGRSDLENKILRTPLSPSESFNDDPLRILRAARFSAGYELKPVQEIVDTAKDLAERILIVSAERIREEVLKLLALENPTKGFEFLEKVDLLPKILSFEFNLDNQNLNKIFSLLPPDDPISRFSIFFKGLSKTKVKESLHRLRMSREERRLIENIVDFLNFVSNGPKSEQWTDEEIRRSLDLNQLNVEESINLIVASDLNVKNFLGSVENLKATENLLSFEPSLTAQELMVLLNLEPGPLVGEILRWLKEIHLRDGPISVDEERNMVMEQWGK